MKIIDLLTDESKWSKEHDACDKQGFYVIPENDRATKWNIRGALIKCYGRGELIMPLYFQVEAAIMDCGFRERANLGDVTKCSVSEFNSHPETTFADVRKVLEAADI